MIRCMGFPNDARFGKCYAENSNFSFPLLPFALSLSPLSFSLPLLPFSVSLSPWTILSLFPSSLLHSLPPPQVLLSPSHCCSLFPASLFPFLLRAWGSKVCMVKLKSFMSTQSTDMIVGRQLSTIYFIIINILYDIKLCYYNILFSALPKLSLPPKLYYIIIFFSCPLF